MNTCILPIFTYSGEVWEASNKNYKEANQNLNKKNPENTTWNPQGSIILENRAHRTKAAIKKTELTWEQEYDKGTKQCKQFSIQRLKQLDKANNKTKEEFQISQEDMKKDL